MNIDQPTLLVDRARCERNLARMVDRAARAGAGLRPHFKTHQSRAVGEWVRAAGVERITVSSIAMAEYFAGAGWEDILVAFPLNPRAAGRFDALARRCRLATLLDHPDAVEALKDRLQAPLGWYADIDTGYARTGIPMARTDRVERLLEAAARVPALEFRGFYAHAGDTYHHANRAEREAIHERAFAGLRALKAHFAAERPRALMGDTPGCSTATAFPGIDEITPGNFVFYDLTQARLGACAEDDIAVAMACPVVGRYPERGEIVIHGGSVHFSKDCLEIDGRAVFGQLAEGHAKGWRPREAALYLTGLSQEHGIVRLPPDRLAETQIGDLVHVLPVHSCLAADAMGGYRGVDGEALDHLRGRTRSARA